MNRGRKPAVFFLAMLAVLVIAGLSVRYLHGVRSRGESSTGMKDTNEMVLMIDTIAIPTVREKVIPLLRARFPEVSIVSRIRDDSQVENSVKSSFASGDRIDLVAFWPHQMRTFIDIGMALDLGPYLDADPAWKDSWIPETLEDGCFDGRYYALPYRISYPLLQINQDLAEKAGVVLKDQWTWEEFVLACDRIGAYYNTAGAGEGNPGIGVFPLGINSTWASWFIRNGFLQIWDNDQELESWTYGNIPFTDPRVKKVFENVKYLYDQNYLYPGPAALTVTNEQALSAFARGKIVILANVNGNAWMAKNNVVAGAFRVAVMSWPNMGKPSRDHLLGSSDGYFIPTNTRDPGLAIEILKYLTGPEILSLHADEGRILPFKNIISSNPEYPLYSRDIRKVYSTEIVNFSSELNDYIIYNTPANYLLYGDQAIEYMELLRGTIRR